MYPNEITPLTEAWYMHEHLGMTYAEIGQKLGCSPQGAYKVVENTFERKSPAVIYRLQQKYCKNDCTDSTENCRVCNLYKFMLKYMVKKR